MALNKAIIIAEKRSQADDIYKAIVKDKDYHKVLCNRLGVDYCLVKHASGHILGLQQPEKVNPDWKKWSSAVLIPNDTDGFYPLEVTDNKLYKDIIKDLKGASVAIIATDCDREGQVIGQNILEHCTFTGTVYRAIFTAQDKISLQNAFGNLQDNSDYIGVYYAGLGRANGDQIANLSNTRAVTTHLKDPKQSGAIGVGRVKTATQAIICERQVQIDTFTPEQYHIPYIIVQGVQLPYASTGDVSPLGTVKTGAFFDNGNLDTFIQGLDSTAMVSKITETKQTAPPKLPDLPELQKATSALWGWGADTTLSTLQMLYDSPNYLTTYPRAECRYIPENMQDNAPVLLDTIGNIFGVTVDKITIRKGKSGAYDTKTVDQHSHHAIIPNINCENPMDTYHSLKADAQKLYALVCQYYMRIHSPNYQYEQTVIQADVNDIIFKTQGAVPVAMGWKSIVFATHTSDTPQPKQNHTLPPIANGNTTIDKVGTTTGTTTPPKQFTDGDIISAMQNAWRYEKDPKIQARLKQSKGIGTPATRDTIIKGLVDQNILQRQGKHIVPTVLGKMMYQIFKAICPDLLSPAETAKMEVYLDVIADMKDSTQARQQTIKYLNLVANKTAKINSAIAQSQHKLPLMGKPKRTFKRKGHK